jgi:hypothetical protein
MMFQQQGPFHSVNKRFPCVMRISRAVGRDPEEVRWHWRKAPNAFGQIRNP